MDAATKHLKSYHANVFYDRPVHSLPFALKRVSFCCRLTPEPVILFFPLPLQKKKKKAVESVIVMLLKYIILFYFFFIFFARYLITKPSRVCVEPLTAERLLII